MFEFKNRRIKVSSPTWISNIDKAFIKTKFYVSTAHISLFSVNILYGEYSCDTNVLQRMTVSSKVKVQIT